jgi:hypothetical protein
VNLQGFVCLDNSCFPLPQKRLDWTIFLKITRLIANDFHPLSTSAIPAMSPHQGTYIPTPTFLANPPLFTSFLIGIHCPRDHFFVWQFISDTCLCLATDTNFACQLNWKTMAKRTIAFLTSVNKTSPSRPRTHPTSCVASAQQKRSGHWGDHRRMEHTEVVPPK